MRITNGIRASLAILAMLGIVSIGFSAVRAESKAEDRDDEETVVTWDQVPAVVKAGFERAVPGKQATGVTRESEDDVVVFEAAYTINGATHEVEIGENGELLATEDTIASADLPAAVADSLKKRFPKGEMGEVVRITQTYYEIEVRIGAKTREARILGNGAFLESDD